MIELFQQARWGDLYNFFSAGNPPLVFQLLALNTIFLMIFMVRKAKGAHRMHSSTMQTTQILLLFSNFAMMFQKELFGMQISFV